MWIVRRRLHGGNDVLRRLAPRAAAGSTATIDGIPHAHVCQYADAATGEDREAGLPLHLHYLPDQRSRVMWRLR